MSKISNAILVTAMNEIHQEACDGSVYLNIEKQGKSITINLENGFFTEASKVKDWLISVFEHENPLKEIPINCKEQHSTNEKNGNNILYTSVASYGEQKIYCFKITTDFKKKTKIFELINLSN